MVAKIGDKLVNPLFLQKKMVSFFVLRKNVAIFADAKALVCRCNRYLG